MDDDLDTLYSQPVQNVDEWRDLFEKVYMEDEAPLKPFDYQKPVLEFLTEPPPNYKPTLWERFLMWIGRLLGFE